MYRTTACFTGLVVLIAWRSSGAVGGAARPRPARPCPERFEHGHPGLDLVSGQPWSNSETTGASAADTATVTGIPGSRPRAASRTLCTPTDRAAEPPPQKAPET